jgi:hypothetical protein
MSLKLNIELMRRGREMNKKADELRERANKIRTFARVREFSKMKDKKLESIRKVTLFYDGKMRTKVLQALRQNAENCL